MCVGQGLLRGRIPQRGHCSALRMQCFIETSTGLVNPNARVDESTRSPSTRCDVLAHKAKSQRMGSSSTPVVQQRSGVGLVWSGTHTVAQPRTAGRRAGSAVRWAGSRAEVEVAHDVARMVRRVGSKVALLSSFSSARPKSHAGTASYVQVRRLRLAPPSRRRIRGGRGESTGTRGLDVAPRHAAWSSSSGRSQGSACSGPRAPCEREDRFAESAAAARLAGHVHAVAGYAANPGRRAPARNGRERRCDEVGELSDTSCRRTLEVRTMARAVADVRSMSTRRPCRSTTNVQ